MKDTENTKKVNPIPTEEVKTEAQLDLNDILAATSFIDVASTRGAFRASELAKVGTVYDRLVAFLQATHRAQNSNKQDATPIAELTQKQ